ncbi:MAG: tetratricopeptide repeat protein [Bacteroidia bacterium]|nr:tetratricopeptide repeat protein [Bacteroidia bacterium]
MKKCIIKRLLVTVFCSVFSPVLFCQSVDSLFQKGIEAIQSEKLDEAINCFDQAIALKNDEFILWYNRATVKSWQRRYEEAILDFNEAIRLNPEHKKSYNGRACAKQDITDYKGALADFNKAIKVDNKYIDALYNRGTLYNLLGKRDKACEDYNLAYKLGDKQSESKVNKCKEEPGDVYPILYLTQTADNDKYGFTSENPVKVGPGPDGGPANERAYLNLLRDVNGKPVSYERVGSCCGYKSDKGFLGIAMLDQYEIHYTNEKGEAVKKLVYISMYDHEDPKILYGFKTVGGKK